MSKNDLILFPVASHLSNKSFIAIEYITGADYRKKKVLFEPDLFPQHKSRTKPCYPRKSKYNNGNIKEPMDLIKTC
jgi:hypothetical protein